MRQVVGASDRRCSRPHHARSAAANPALKMSSCTDRRASAPASPSIKAGATSALAPMRATVPPTKSPVRRKPAPTRAELPRRRSSRTATKAAATLAPMHRPTGEERTGVDARSPPSTTVAAMKRSPRRGARLLTRRKRVCERKKRDVIPRLPSASVAGGLACALRWGEAATRTRSALGFFATLECELTRGGALRLTRSRPAWRSSRSSRAGTIRTDATLPLTITRR